MTNNIAPFVLVRAAGGSIKSLQCTDTESSVKYIENIISLDRTIENIKEPLNDILYKLISRIKDDETNFLRFLLKLKRDIYNMRAVNISAEHQVMLKNRLSYADYNLLMHWYTSTCDRSKTMELAKRAFEEEIKEASKQLAKEMEDKEWQKGMALANPKYLASYNKYKIKLWRPHKQYARSSMAYLGRITVKTSPFSTFTKLGLSSFSSEEMSVPSSQKTSFCSISKSICTELIFEMALHPELSQFLTYEKNISLRVIDQEHIQLIKSSYVILNGFAWRNDQLICESVTTKQINIVKSIESGSYSKIKELISNTPFKFNDLIVAQWIKPVIPFSRKSEQPLLDLYEMLKSIEVKKARRLARIVKWMQSCLDTLSLSEAKERLRYHQMIIQLAKKAFQEITNNKPKSLQNEKLVYENVKLSEIHPPLGEYVKCDLEKISNKLRNYQFRTHLYDLLCEHFVSSYGKGGVCDNIQEFLFQFEQRKDRPRLIKNALRKDKRTAERLEESRVFAPYSASSAPPIATVFYQLASNHGSEEDISAGDYRLIINQINSGLGLLLRFQSMFKEEQSNLGELMRNWTHSLNSEAKIVHFPMIADFSNLQTDPGILSTSLRWPGENPMIDSNDLQLNELCLIHEEPGILTFVDKEGCPIAPMYFGAVPQHMVQGPMSHLFTIMMPWINAFKGNWVSSPLFSASPPPEEVEFHDRIQEGRIVYRRARWRIPAFLFPHKEKSESEYAYYLRLKTFQKRYGLPDEGFLLGERVGISLNSKQRKPIYMNFNSYHSIEAAISTAAAEHDLLSVTFTEALPNRYQHWLKNEEGQVIASEYMSLFKWPNTNSKDIILENQKGVLK
ncbi:lantibiotic dehydratase [Bacillus velezensis]|uniref:lantibiotic dehydratase n=1 Tax=Bacillus velezensis TaxID=492670 RepID=UPI00156A7E27|nr:lantibiotic dehydratase [Bacillus velezensis]NRR26432.1 lantibiotic dehydratase [Bacillus velezensis]